MSALIGFLLGLLADLARSVFLPASTEWINRRIPWLRKTANINDNILMMNLREKLISQGMSPDLAKYAYEDTNKFLDRLSSQTEAFVENAMESITMITQAEMNGNAAERAQSATLHMEKALSEIENSGFLNETQLTALAESQKHWNAYAKAQAEFAGAEFEGGSMQPSIYLGELESVTISRTGDLKRILAELKERYS